MDCGYKEKTILYFYGELPDGAVAEIRDHLKTCSQCAAEVSILKSLSEDLDVFRPRPPETDAVILSAAIGGISGGRPLHGFMRYIAAGAAAALFLAAFHLPDIRGASSAWQSGIDTGLENVSDRIYALEDEIAYTASADFDHAYSDLEIQKEEVEESIG